MRFMQVTVYQAYKIKNTQISFTQFGRLEKSFIILFAGYSIITKCLK